MHEPIPTIPPLPPVIDYSSARLTDALGIANKAISQVREQAAAFPYQSILIDRLGLIDAKASCAIAGIETTDEDVFATSLQSLSRRSGPAKEVLTHRAVMKRGFDRLAYDDHAITRKTLIEMYRMITSNSDAMRMMPGPVLRDDNGVTIHEPPGDALEIQAQMQALEPFINDDSSGIDPLIRMALILHQFETIQPFLYGNGRLGRILASLFLVRSGLLEAPTLSLSTAINASLSSHYGFSQSVREAADWEDWIIHILKAVTTSSNLALGVIDGMQVQLTDFNQQIREELPTVYSSGLIGSLFRHPYTRVEFLQNDIGISAKKAKRCLNTLAEFGYLTKHPAEGFDFFINDPLVALLKQSSIASRL